MASMYFNLQSNFTPRDVMRWYDVAAVGDAAIITIPSRVSTLQLLRTPNNFVHWWPEGGRGVTVSLEDAVRRLEMLSDDQYAEA
jgi:hypothetical protein